MTRYAGYIICCQAVILFMLAGNIYASPRFEVDKDVFDAGAVSQGKVITHEFVFKNSGDEPLKVKVRGA